MTFMWRHLAELLWIMKTKYIKGPLEYAKLHLDRPVLWTDMTKLELLGPMDQLEDVQSCYGVLWCCRKWESGLYEGHHELFKEFNQRFARKCLLEVIKDKRLCTKFDFWGLNIG